MIIELYGLPASGKSTFAKQLSETTGYKIIKIRKKKELFFYNFVFFIKHPIKAVIGFKYILKNSTGWASFRYKFLNAYLDYNAKYQKALWRKRGIMDQGYFQNIVTLFDDKRSEEDLRKFVKNFLKPDLLLIFDINKEMRENWTRDRGYFARVGLDFVDMEKWREAMEENNRAFLDILKDIGVECIIITAESDYNEVINKIKELRN